MCTFKRRGLLERSWTTNSIACSGGGFCPAASSLSASQALRGGGWPAFSDVLATSALKQSRQQPHTETSPVLKLLTHLFHFTDRMLTNKPLSGNSPPTPNTGKVQGRGLRRLLQILSQGKVCDPTFILSFSWVCSLGLSQQLVVWAPGWVSRDSGLAMYVLLESKGM